MKGRQKNETWQVGKTLIQQLQACPTYTHAHTLDPKKFFIVIVDDYIQGKEEKEEKGTEKNKMK